ncbi:MAG: hypothetical protein WCJ64_08745 [Rhodospirillaceae bacterium]
MARTSGASEANVGDLMLANIDQGLNGLLNQGLDGWSLIDWLGPQNGQFPSQFTRFLTAVATGVNALGGKMLVHFSDPQLILRKPVQVNSYLGNNSPPHGKEGGQDLLGRLKPLGFGLCLSVPPVWVNSSKLIGQVHDGAISTVLAITDQGVGIMAGADYGSLALLEAATVSASSYSTCLGEGLFRLGSTPVGEIRVSFRGDAQGGYTGTAGGIIQRLLQRAGVASGSIGSSFSSFAAAVPVEVGCWYAGNAAEDFIQAVDEVAAAVGAWVVPDRSGTWQIGQLALPSGAALIWYDDATILEIDRITTRDEGGGIPAQAITLDYARYWATQSVFAGAVDIASRADLGREWRQILASDATVAVSHPQAPRLSQQSLITSSTDAASEVTRRLALRKIRADFIECKVALQSWASGIDIGALVGIKSSQAGFIDGKTFRYLGEDVDANGTILMHLWG